MELNSIDIVYLLPEAADRAPEGRRAEYVPVQVRAEVCTRAILDCGYFAIAFEVDCVAERDERVHPLW